MSLLFRLLLVLTLVPLAEAAILVQVARWLTWGPTIGLIVATGVLGAWLARREGLKVLQRIRADLAAGVLPADALVNAGLVLAAGLLLVTPGILTDLCGFGLLVPPIRAWVQPRLAEAFRRHVSVVSRTGQEPFVDIEAVSTDAAGPAKNDRIERDQDVSRSGA